MNNRSQQTIPPELPDSPIEAWRHYYISMDAEEKAIKELEENNADSLVVGIGVGYRFIPHGSPDDETGTRFYMAHGYHVGSEEEWVEESQQSDLPEGADESDTAEKGESQGNEGFDENFIDALYEEVRQLFLEYAPEGSGEYLVSLEVTSAHFSKPKLTCQGRKCDFCSEHQTKHVFKKRKKGSDCVWVCDGKPCG